MTLSPDNVPDSLVQGFRAAMWDSVGPGYDAEPSEDDIRAALAAVLPAYEDAVRSEIATWIEAQQPRCPHHHTPDEGHKAGCCWCWHNAARRADAAFARGEHGSTTAMVLHRFARAPQDAPTAPAQPATDATGDTDTTDGAASPTDDLSALRERIADALAQWAHTIAGGRPGMLLPRDEAIIRENNLARAAVVMDVIRPVLEDYEIRLRNTAHQFIKRADRAEQVDLIAGAGQ